MKHPARIPLASYLAFLVSPLSSADLFCRGAALCAREAVFGLEGLILVDTAAGFPVSHAGESNLEVPLS